MVRESQDRAKDAIALLEEALQGRVRLLGPRDRAVFASASNLAQAYDKSGDIERSLAMLIESLRVAEDLPDAPRMTLIELNNNIGATYQDLNLDQDAAPYLRKADELAQQWLRPDSPDALTLRANLASLEAELGNPQRAMELLQEVIATRTRVLGPDAYDTLTSRYAYCNTMWIAKRFDDAAAGFLQLLPDVIRAQKDGSFLAASTRLSIARAYADNGRLADAEPYARKALEQFTALYGPEHARTRNAASVLAKIGETGASHQGASPNE
jgi:tetratricopeptide (TPR) repeat protein